MKPTYGSLDYPPSLVSPHTTSIVTRFLLSILPMRTVNFESHLGQLFTQRIAIVGLVEDERDPRRQLNAFGDRVQGWPDQLCLWVVGCCNESPDRSAAAIRDDLHLHALANLGFPDLDPPFCASKKVASPNSSSSSIPPASASFPRTIFHTASQTPAAHHSACRRQHVEAEPNSRGMSCQRMEFRKTYTIPPKHRRSSRRGRPPKGLLGRGGRRSFTNSHNSSERACSFVTLGMADPPCLPLR